MHPNDTNGGYYIVIPQEVYKTVNSTTALVYGVLLSIVNYRNGACYASNQFIGERIGVSARTVSDSIRNLKNEGFIKVIVGQNTETGLNYRKIVPMSSFLTFQKSKSGKGKAKSVEPEWFQDYLKELDNVEEAV